MQILLTEFMKIFLQIFREYLLTKHNKGCIIEFVARINAGIAQLVEQRIRNAQVACSSHVSGSKRILQA